MKIYFEDGKLDPTMKFIINHDFFIDAANGYSFCEDRLEVAKHFHPNCTIYTNSLVALYNPYVWNDELKVPELYLRHKNTLEWTRVDQLTARELRQGHNLMKMYMAGEFHNFKTYPLRKEMLNETVG